MKHESKISPLGGVPTEQFDTGNNLAPDTPSPLIAGDSSVSIPTGKLLARQGKSEELTTTPHEAASLPKGELSPTNQTSRFRQALDWIAEAYAGRGKTIANGIASSALAVPISIVVGNGTAHLGWPKLACGAAALLASMTTWDATYSAQLYYFYDRKLMPREDGKVVPAEIWKQAKRYATACWQADGVWTASYLSIYSIAQLATPPGKAAAIAHLLSIAYIDLLRPVQLKWMKTLKMDQGKDQSRD